MQCAHSHPSTLEWPMVQGHIVACNVDQTWVQVDGLRCAATCAASCLLQPQVGDQVLLVCDQYSAQHYWILAILVRTPQHSAQIQINGALTIASTGPLTLSSGQDLHITNLGTQHLTSGALRVDSSSAQVCCSEVTLCAKVVQMTTQVLRQWSDQVEQMVGRVLQRFKQRFCCVAEHDEQRSGSQRQLVQGALLVQAQSVTQRAQDQMILEGKQIHLS